MGVRLGGVVGVSSSPNIIVVIDAFESGAFAVRFGRMVVVLQ